MKTNNFFLFSFLFLFGLSTSTGCAEDGKTGTTGVDCGVNGTEHNGHCHCNSGYLFAEETCLEAESITAICVAYVEEGSEHDATTSQDAHEHETDLVQEEEHHHHDACLCPATGVCPCDHGTVETIGAKSYCVPELHAD